MGIKFTKPEGEKIVEEILSAYPEKAQKDRVKHIQTVDAEDTKCNPLANRKSRPGVMTQRGCAYAGAKGVVYGPIKDMVNISHGPVGCGQYSWGSRRNYYTGYTGVDSFGVMQFTSDFQERDIVFGGDKNLETIVDEIDTLFPLARAVSILSECPIGLIGDDIEAVARKGAEKIGKPIIPVRCEGFRGVSQSLGHHIANDTIRDWVVDNDAFTGSEIEDSPYNIALVGDYNIGGDAWVTRSILEEMGLNVVAQWTGDGTMNEMLNTTKVKLNVIHCYRSMNYIMRHMEEKYGIPWVEFNFFGPSQIIKSMRKIASLFDETIQAKTEAVIAEQYEPKLKEIVEFFKPRLEGKTAMVYVGGLRPRHVVTAFEDLGIQVTVTGYEFAHGDDYQRTLEYVKDPTVVVDDASEYEIEELKDKFKPDLFASGIKEKYQSHKSGIPFRQFHSWDYSGPYHGVDGFAVFARDVDMAINGPVWKNLTPPWKQETAAKA